MILTKQEAEIKNLCFTFFPSLSGKKYNLIDVQITSDIIGINLLCNEI